MIYRYVITMVITSVYTFFLFYSGTANAVVLQCPCNASISCIYIYIYYRPIYTPVELHYKRSSNKPSYNKVIFLVPAIYISCFFTLGLV